MSTFTITRTTVAPARTKPSLLSATAPVWQPKTQVVAAVKQDEVITPTLTSVRPTPVTGRGYSILELLQLQQVIDADAVPQKFNPKAVADILPSSSLSKKSLPSTPPRPILSRKPFSGPRGKSVIPLPPGTYTVESSILNTEGKPKGLVMVAPDGAKFTRNFDDPNWKAQQWQIDEQGRPYSAVMLYMVYQGYQTQMTVRSQLSNPYSPDGSTFYYLDSEQLIRAPGEPRPDHVLADLPLGTYHGENLYLNRDNTSFDVSGLLLSVRNLLEGGRVFTIPLTNEMFLGVVRKAGSVTHPLTTVSTNGIKGCTLKVQYHMEKRADRMNRSKVLLLY